MELELTLVPTACGVSHLERGTFAWPGETDTAPVDIRSADLLLLLAETNLAQTRRRRWYERVA